MAGPIGNHDLPSIEGETRLRREVPVAADFASLSAAMHHDNSRV
jgi:hypothetical protein